MKIEKRFIRLCAVLCLLMIMTLPAKAQKLIDIDLEEWVKTVPFIPPTIHEVHDRFSLPGPEGARFADALILNPVYQQAVDWLSDIHAAAISNSMKEHPMAEMTYKVQFDDERRRLTLRPMVGAGYMKHTWNNPKKIELVQQLAALEKTFDWQQYYKAYEKINKELIAKDAEWNSLAFKLERQIPMIQTEWGLQKDPKKEKEVTDMLAQKKLKDGVEMFQKHQQAWIHYFNKYVDAISKFQQVRNSVYFDQADQLLIRFMAEVQARALEAMERLIWVEYTLVGHGELLFFDEQILKRMLIQEGQ